MRVLELQGSAQLHLVETPAEQDVEPGHDRQCLRFKSGVTNPLGELQRPTSVDFGVLEPPQAAETQGEAKLDASGNARFVPDMEQRLFEQPVGVREAVLVIADLPEEAEDVSLDGALRRLAEHAFEQSARRGHLTSVESVLRHADRPPLLVGGSILGREVPRPLSQLGPALRRSAGAGVLRGEVEGGGKVRVGTLGTEGAVPCLFLQIRDQCRQGPVDPPAVTRRSGRVHRGSEQGMGETEARAIDLEKPMGLGIFNRLPPLDLVISGGRPDRLERGRS